MGDWGVTSVIKRVINVIKVTVDMPATKKETLIKIPTGDGPYVRAKHAQVISD